MTRLEVALAWVLFAAFAFLLAVILHGCFLDRSPGDVAGSADLLALPCVPTFLEQGRVELAACPDPRHLEHVGEQAWCECPRIVSDGRYYNLDSDAGVDCGSEYVSTHPDGIHPYERQRACP